MTVHVSMSATAYYFVCYQGQQFEKEGDIKFPNFLFVILLSTAQVGIWIHILMVENSNFEIVECCNFDHLSKNEEAEDMKNVLRKCNNFLKN